MPFVTVGELARKFHLASTDLSSFIGRNARLREAFPVISGRRLIPATDVGAIELELRRAGWIDRNGKGTR
jgi:hypothetical protein